MRVAVDKTLHVITNIKEYRNVWKWTSWEKIISQNFVLLGLHFILDLDLQKAQKLPFLLENLFYPNFNPF